MIIIAMLSSMLFFSCGEKEEEVNVPLTVLIAGSEQKTWVITGNTTNGEDRYSQQEECVVDNLIIFYSNGVAEIREGKTKCGEVGDDLVFSGTWSINEETNEFIWDETFKILNITDDKLVLEYTDPETRTEITLEKVN
jgi:hypothetical protein